VVLDATTQPGYSGTPLIELNGASGTSIQSSGFLITAGGSTVRGFAINRFKGSGIDLRTGGSNTIEANFIGTNPAGTVGQGNFTRGVSVDSSNNVIGGTASGEGNLISGNPQAGVAIVRGLTDPTGNQVIGNLIGVNAAATAPLITNDPGFGPPGQTAGVLLRWVSSNTVGGTAIGAGNVLSGGNQSGVSIEGLVPMFPADSNIVAGNRIGTGPLGTEDLGNQNTGVSLFQATNSVIGGTMAGAGNVIANNGAFGGVNLQNDAADGNAILGNSIYGQGDFLNSEMGIELDTDGVTANDTDDPDTGPNELQNFPVLTSVTAGTSNTMVGGSLNSIPSTLFRLEFFANPACHASGNGEGRRFLGFSNVTTDGGGDVGFNLALAGLVAGGDAVTATATDPSGNTSEFSACRMAPGTTPPGNGPGTTLLTPPLSGATPPGEICKKAKKKRKKRGKSNAAAAKKKKHKKKRCGKKKKRKKK
jgi:hypothetical protein